MKSKLAIFDLDGTLFDTREVNYLAYREALMKHGFSLEKDYYYNECNGKFYKEFLPAISTNDQDVLESIHHMKKELYLKYIGMAKKNICLFDVVRGMKNSHYLAIVTTASHKNCVDILEHFRVMELFDLILTHDDVKKVKPDPEGFIKAMGFFSVQAIETMIFEDSREGIMAAQKSGASVFVVRQF